MNIHESGENYLETILLLQQQKGNVRSVDIVNELGYSKSSVSRAVNILQNAGLIIIAPGSGAITFTESGIRRAQEVYVRHNILNEFLILLGINEKTAETDACRIEHVISADTFDAIKIFVEKNKNT
ncbi:MAG: metal-dependent transcriptional regulator [Clostridia bacterium]|nr:metal-dependent transcriptional regulator [Clostridia bacterium]